MLNPDNKTLGWVWNPITGCNNQIDGFCKGGGFKCYAYKLANGRLRNRYLSGGIVATEGVDHENLLDPFYPRLWRDRLIELQSLSTTPYYSQRRLPSEIKPRGIFVCDMGELFGDWVPRQWQAEIFKAIKGHPQHRFYLLTKQPQNLAKYSPFPDNCWVGVSATNQAMYDSAVYYLNKIKASVTYISIEPLLSHIHLPNYKDVDWIILGGLSGKQPFFPPEEWIQEIEEAADRAGTAIFEKDNLRKSWHRPPRREFPDG